MNFLLNFFPGAWAQRLGWVLIHFLWEGTIIALVLAVLLRLLTKASSHIRYALTGVALLACAIAPIITWTMLVPQPEEPLSLVENNPANPPPCQSAVASPTVAVPPGQQAPVETTASWTAKLVEAANAALPYAVALWVAGVVVLSTRLTLGWIWMMRLCHSGIPAKDPRCLEKFAGLLTRMRIDRPVRLLESALVEVPTLIGWLRPTILIPVSILIGLTPNQLEAIFAHELAHVRRNDYLVNLFQTVIETILFYHPAVWWISRKLREERENCCDDIALEVMADRLVYVSALAKLEESRAMPLALSASGGPLLLRIRRIVGVKDPKVPAWPLVTLIAVIFLVACLTELKGADPANPSMPPSQTFSQQMPSESYWNGALEKDLTMVADSSVHSSTLLTDAEMLQAIKKGDSIALGHLLEHGVDPNTFDPDRFGSTPAYWAVYFNQRGCLKLLLDHFARDDGPTHQSSESALDLAQRTHPNLVPVLEEGFTRNRAILSARLKTQLHSIRIDLPNFLDTPLRDVTDFLLKVTSKAGYLERGVGIGSMDLPPSTTFTSTGRSNITIWDALQIITSANNLKFAVDDAGGGVVTLYPPRDEAVIHPLANADTLQTTNIKIPASVASPTTISSISGLLNVPYAAHANFAASTGVLVGDNGTQYRLVFDDKGRFEIPNVKPGTYREVIHFVCRPGDSVTSFDHTFGPTVVTADDRCSVRLSWDPTPAPPGSVQISLKIVEIDNDVYLANQDKIDATIEKGGYDTIELLHKMKGVDLVSAPSVTTMPGLKAEIDIVREFPYPISFDPAEKVTNTFPTKVLPPTPRDFQRRDVGVTTEIMPTVVHDKIDLYCDLHITDFVGFTKTNQAVQSPAFDTREVNLLEEFDNGTEMKAALIPGFRFEEETVTDRDNAGKVLATTQKTVKKRLIVFLNAGLVPPILPATSTPKI